MRRAELPTGLGQRFTVREAAGAGVSRSRLRASDLDAPHRGLRERLDGVRSEAGATVYERMLHALAQRAAVYAHVMPDNQFFVGPAAAAIWRLPLPTSLLSAHRPLDVAVFAPVRHPRREGIRGHQARPHLVRVVERAGVRVADPASTWASMAPLLAAEGELVALGDAVVREAMFRGDRPPLATRDQLEATVAAGRRAGIARLRRAVGRVRTRSASSSETRCRLLLIDAGLPEPELNVSVRDAAGRLIAVVDLAFWEQRVAVEYEGEQHRTDPIQWARDIARHEELAARGWTVIRVTREQLYGDPRSVVARVRRALGR